MKSEEAYLKLINGEYPGIIIKILSDDLVNTHIRKLLNNNEEFNETRADKIIIKREDKIKELYKSIFPVSKIKGYFQIGSLYFDKTYVEELLRTCNLLSGNLRYE